MIWAPGIVQLVGELFCGIERVAWHRDPACSHGAIVGDHELRAIGHEDRHPVAFLNPQ